MLKNILLKKLKVMLLNIINYKTAIEEATTIEEVEAIVIDYTTNEVSNETTADSNN